MEHLEKKKTLTHSGFKGLIAQSFDNAQVLHIWRYILMLTEGFLKKQQMGDGHREGINTQGTQFCLIKPYLG